MGAATARRLFRDGASVVLADLPSSGGAALAEELECVRGLQGRSAVFSPADVTNEAEVQAAVDTAAAWGRCASW